MHTDHGSEIDPPLDPSWPEIDRLRWNAGVAQADEGITVHVTEIDGGLFSLHGNTSVTNPDGSVTKTAWGSTAVPFDMAWRSLSDMARGAGLARGYTTGRPE